MIEFKSLKELKRKIEAYFEGCREDERHICVAGLAGALSFLDKSELRKYAESGKFGDEIKRALLMIEAHTEQFLFCASGAKVYLERNFKDWNENSLKEEDNTEKSNLLESIKEAIDEMGKA